MTDRERSRVSRLITLRGIAVLIAAVFALARRIAGEHERTAAFRIDDLAGERLGWAHCRPAASICLLEPERSAFGDGDR